MHHIGEDRLEELYGEELLHREPYDEKTSSSSDECADELADVCGPLPGEFLRKTTRRRSGQRGHDQWGHDREKCSCICRPADHAPADQSSISCNSRLPHDDEDTSNNSSCDNSSDSDRGIHRPPRERGSCSCAGGKGKQRSQGRRGGGSRSSSANQSQHPFLAAVTMPPSTFTSIATRIVANCRHNSRGDGGEVPPSLGLLLNSVYHWMLSIILLIAWKPAVEMEVVPPGTGRAEPGGSRAPSTSESDVTSSLEDGGAAGTTSAVGESSSRPTSSHRPHRPHRRRSTKETDEDEDGFLRRTSTNSFPGSFDEFISIEPHCYWSEQQYFPTGIVPDLRLFHSRRSGKIPRELRSLVSGHWVLDESTFKVGIPARAPAVRFCLQALKIFGLKSGFRCRVHETGKAIDFQFEMTCRFFGTLKNLPGVGALSDAVVQRLRQTWELGADRLCTIPMIGELGSRPPLTGHIWWSPTLDAFAQEGDMELTTGVFQHIRILLRYVYPPPVENFPAGAAASLLRAGRKENPPVAGAQSESPVVQDGSSTTSGDVSTASTISGSSGKPPRSSRAGRLLTWPTTLPHVEDHTDPTSGPPATHPQESSQEESLVPVAPRGPPIPPPLPRHHDPAILGPGPRVVRVGPSRQPAQTHDRRDAPPGPIHPNEDVDKRPLAPRPLLSQQVADGDQLRAWWAEEDNIREDPPRTISGPHLEITRQIWNYRSKQFELVCRYCFVLAQK